MPFGLGMFRSLLTRNNLQAPQAQIGAMAPQSPMRARRAVQQEAGGGAIGGMGTPTAGSQPQDGVQIAANRPRTFNAPGSMAEISGVEGLNSNAGIPTRPNPVVLPPTPNTNMVRPPEADVLSTLPTRVETPSLPVAPRRTLPFDLKQGLIDRGLTNPTGGRPGYADNPYAPIIDEASKEFGVDPYLIAGVMAQESANKPGAVSPAAGAKGLMQLMDGTARRFGVTDPFDPKQNIRAGAQYLSFLGDRYKGDQTKTLAGYNAGEGNVDKYGGTPPFKETQNYVRQVPERINALRARATPGRSGVDLNALDAAREEMSQIATSDVNLGNPTAGLDPTRYRSSATEGLPSVIGGSSPSAPQPWEMELARTQQEFDQLTQNLNQRAQQRSAERERILGERPELKDARAIADQEVKQKGKLWRLGQVGLGALKGFVGANPNGGSGILGALSGAVGGGTGDLYRQNRIAGIQENYGQQRQAWKDRLDATNTLQDNDVQMDRVVNTAAVNNLNLQRAAAELQAKFDKGEISRQEFEQEKLKFEEVKRKNAAIEQQKANELKDREASREDQQQFTSEENKKKADAAAKRQTEQNAFRQREAEKARAAKGSTTGQAKRMTDSDVRNEATKRINRLVDQELSKQGIKPDDPDDKVVAPNPADPKSPITAGRIRKRLNRKYFDKEGYYQGALQGSIAANIRRQEAGEDVEDFAGTPFETKKSLSRPGVK